MAAPSSAKESAPKRESMAPTTHAANTIETERPSRAISAGFRKMPVPIIVPTTMAVEAQGPRPRTSSRRFSVMGEGESECNATGGRGMSGCGGFGGKDTADERAGSESDRGTDQHIPGEGDRREAVDQKDGG